MDITHDVLEASISHDVGGFGWYGILRLVSVSSYTSINPGDIFDLELNGELYKFLAETKAIRRSEGLKYPLLDIHVASPLVLKGFPWAMPITRTWNEPLMAKDIVEDVLGETVQWDIVDWLMPKGRLAVTGASPLDVAKIVVGAAGGVLYARKDGTLIAKPAYDVSVANWEAATPAHVFTDVDDNISMSTEIRRLAWFNKVLLTDGSSEDIPMDRYDIVDTDSEEVKTLRIYSFPWRTNIEVVHTGGEDISLVYEGEQSGTVTETLEFINGVATTTTPIASLGEGGVVWKSVSLGAVSMISGTKTLTVGDTLGDYGLATVTYATRYLQYRITGMFGSIVQLLISDTE